MPDLYWLSIKEASDLLRKRKLSSVDLTRAHLDRIASVDPQLRSYITVTAGIAVEQAREADEQIAHGRYRGPLHGIPISYKDIIATAGTLTTGGSRIYENWIPTADAHVVTRLREAGAVMLGKATTFQFAWTGTTEEDFVKPARNPWNLMYSSGGSSNGSAAGVAGGLAMASIASDSGGSIRNPANLCGVTGLKPTYGLVGRTGVLPLSYSFDTVGPLARTAEDCALLLEVIAGFDAADPASSPAPAVRQAASFRRSLKGLRIGLLPSYIEAIGADAEVLVAYDKAVQVFRSLGADVQDVQVPHLTYASAATWTILRIEGFAVHFRRMRDERNKLGVPFLRNTAVGGYLSPADYLRAQKARRLISNALSVAFRSVDLILTLTNPRAASPPTYNTEPTDAKVRRSGIAYVTPFNVNGSPAITLPSGLNAAKVPMSIQLAGRPFEDATVLAAAHAYQRVTDWHRHRPPQF
jgi:aspartyl-tRNA(Asn)/glutamyl-tRNA(Gln) amidotransferase subunit A